MYDVVPLFMPICNWRGYIDFCQRNLNYSPTRELDANSIPVDSPEAVLGGLKFGKDVLNAISDPETNGRHYTMGFIIKCDESLMPTLAETGLIVSTLELKRQYAVILSGSIVQWRAVFGRYLTLDQSYEVRMLFTEILKHVEASGLKRVFSSFDITQHNDSTYLVRRRR